VNELNNLTILSTKYSDSMELMTNSNLIYAWQTRTSYNYI